MMEFRLEKPFSYKIILKSFKAGWNREFYLHYWTPTVHDRSKKTFSSERVFFLNSSHTKQNCSLFLARFPQLY